MSDIQQGRRKTERDDEGKEKSKEAKTRLENKYHCFRQGFRVNNECGVSWCGGVKFRAKG